MNQAGRGVLVAQPNRPRPVLEIEMATKINYLTHTWQPIAMRCSPCSIGCNSCWHLPMCKRHAANPKLPEVLRIARGGGPFALMEDVLMQPLRWRKPRVVGVQFMGDWLHEKVKPEWIDRMLEVMGYCSRHTWLTLTKRIENYHEKVYESTLDCPCRELGGGDWLRNHWNGLTVCNQEEVDRKVPLLLKTLAGLLWLSIEPMLGPISLTHLREPGIPAVSLVNGLTGECHPAVSTPWARPHIGFVVVGCESGPKRRECKLEWVQSIIDQCQAAKVPVWVKQVSDKGEIIHDADKIAALLGRTVGEIRQMPGKIQH
jgi:protein gp37